MSFQSHEDLYIQLSEDEKELANSLISLSQKVGPINKSDGIWVGYENAENNPTKNIGVKCGNCALHKSENTCIILDQQIEMDIAENTNPTDDYDDGNPWGDEEENRDEYD